MYKIKVEKFEGPLDLLLSLIEKEKLDITQVSLAGVTEQYIHFIEESESISPEELADFLVIAAKLLLIKSKILLPYLQQGEEEDSGLELEQQLKMYKLFVEATANVERLLKKRKFSYFRESSKMFEAIFIPPKNIKKSDLRNVFYAIIKGIEPVITFIKRAVRKSISLREKIFHIKEILMKAEESNFNELLSQAKSKTEIIVTFLALLELVKQRDIAVMQDDMFSDITIKKINEYKK